MASKGQQFRSYSAELKQIILREYFDGVGTSRTLSLKYDIPFKTINNWITKDNRGCPGSPKSKNLTLEDYKERYEILKKYQAFLQARRVIK